MNDKAKLLLLVSMLNCEDKNIKKKFVEVIKEDNKNQLANVYEKKQIKDANIKQYRNKVKKLKFSKRLSIAKNSEIYLEKNKFINLYSKYLNINPFKYSKKKEIIPVKHLEELYLNYDNEIVSIDDMFNENIKKRDKRNKITEVTNNWINEYDSEAQLKLDKMGEVFEGKRRRRLLGVFWFEKMAFLLSPVIILLVIGGTSVLSLIPFVDSYATNLNDLLAKDLLKFLATILVYLGVIGGTILTIYGTYVKEIKTKEKKSKKYIKKIRKEISRKIKKESKRLRRFIKRKVKWNKKKRYNLKRVTQINENLSMYENHSSYIEKRFKYFDRNRKKIFLLRLVIELLFISTLLYFSMQVYQMWNILI